MLVPALMHPIAQPLAAQHWGSAEGRQQPLLPHWGRGTRAILKPNILSWSGALPPPEFQYDASVMLLPKII